MTADQVTLLLLRLAMVALLYLFLAWVIRALWADLRAGNRSAGAVPGARLIVVDGGTELYRPGESFPVRVVTTIGRLDDNALVVEDEFVSSHHAVLRRERGVWWLSDVGSTNGTWANERKVERPVMIKPGDTLRFGRLQVRFEA